MATFNIRYDGEIVAVVEAEDASSPHTSITKVGDNDEAWGRWVTTWICLG